MKHHDTAGSGRVILLTKSACETLMVSQGSKEILQLGPIRNPPHTATSAPMNAHGAVIEGAAGRPSRRAEERVEIAGTQTATHAASLSRSAARGEGIS